MPGGSEKLSVAVDDEEDREPASMLSRLRIRWSILIGFRKIEPCRFHFQIDAGPPDLCGRQSPHIIWRRMVKIGQTFPAWRSKMAVAVGRRNGERGTCDCAISECTDRRPGVQPDEPNRRLSLVWSYGGVPYSLWGSLMPFRFPDDAALHCRR